MKNNLRRKNFKKTFSISKIKAKTAVTNREKFLNSDIKQENKYITKNQNLKI